MRSGVTASDDSMSDSVAGLHYVDSANATTMLNIDPDY